MENKETIENELRINEVICPELFDMFGIIGHIANDYLIKIQDLLQDNFEDPYYETMDIKISMNLVREYLTLVDPKYLDVFEKSLVDGTFDLHLPEDDLIIRPSNPQTTDKPNASINIPVKYTIGDGGVIVHEFFHYLNDDDGELVGAREIYTEMISIYFELRYYQFLVEKGYNNLYFYSDIFERISSTCDSADNLCILNSTLDVYHNTGSINRKNIRFMDKYRGLYKGNIRNIIEFYNSKEFNDDIKYHKSEISYVIGTLLTFMALKNVKLYDMKMKYINDNINTISINDVLNILGVNIDEYPVWINECYNRLEEAIGEVYEERDMHSGSYRSR